MAITIRKGDTLSKIAKQYGTTVSALSSANGISNPNKITAGRTLNIPSSNTRNSVPSAITNNISQTTVPSAFNNGTRTAQAFTSGNQRISQNYGERKSLYKKFGHPEGHEGIDISVPVGTPIYSPFEGKVEIVGNSKTTPNYSNYGNWVRIRNTQTGETYNLAHLSTSNVKQGQVLKQGDVIGKTGNTGFTSGPHLHIGYIDSQGNQKNPMESALFGGYQAKNSVPESLNSVNQVAQKTTYPTSNSVSSFSQNVQPLTVPKAPSSLITENNEGTVASPLSTYNPFAQNYEKIDSLEKKRKKRNELEDSLIM